MRASLTVFAGLILLFPGCIPSAPPPPGVCLIIVDTLRADRLGCYGESGVVSPELDALADGGVLFENVLAPCSWTRPSIAGLLTGRHPRSLGIFSEDGDALPPGPNTLAEVLRSCGWATFGITANPNINACFGFARGFDEYVDSDVVFEFMERGDEQTTYAFGRTALPRSRSVLERALAWAGANPGRRGFLLIDLMEVHEHERQLRPPFRRRFDGHPDQGYMAAIAQISQDVGRFVDDLRDLPGWEDTLVVVTSDHGEALAGDHPDVVVKPHGDLLYESQLRVPLILSRPGVIAARRVADPVRLLDVMPTVLELCGLSPPPGTHGVSLAGLVLGGRQQALPAAFVAETAWRERNKLAVYSGGWRYVENRDGHPGTDPVELQRSGGGENGSATNRIRGHGDVASTLAEHLERWERAWPRATATAGAPLGDAARQQLEDIGYTGD